MSGLCLELARLTGRSPTETVDTWLDEFGEELVSELLLDTMELERFEQGPDNELRSYLDKKMGTDDNLQFFRLSADFSKIPSWKVIKYRWLLANESESFYRCISTEEQWLRTVIQPQKQNPDAIEIHSNVVPRQAYLTRLAGVMPNCPGRVLCMRGFVPTGVLLRDAEPPRQCCENCTLMTQLRGGAGHTDAAVAKFWEFLNEDVFKTVTGHASLGQGSQGGVEKIMWRKGIFVRKRFDLSQKPYFIREFSVAINVSHPNIVHYFGYSLWSDEAEYSDLYMELLEGDLEKLLFEGARKEEDRLSYEDSLEVLLQIAKAMRHLHERNFVHGDLKPGNIFVSRLPMPHSDAQFCLVKVADFGCAQYVDSNSGATVKPFDYAIGTLHYAAPEVLRCRKHRDSSLIRHPQKIDVYSFGVVAYQVITGVTIVYPKGLRGIRDRVMDGTLRPDDPSLRKLPVLDDDCLSLLRFVRKCWDPNPDERPTFEQICARLY
ncbi:hypothetical protein KC19_11G063700 [Ceratodon purpureus]|uniref:Protein kinase domain-containing protein n=1 Tax=Ceratodon purpureus TaxID=3225 RepID=A0A8T0GHC8_CERPU|nr:hypothetical protein KC19_11G063700 [Ceratodon purpureus]